MAEPYYTCCEDGMLSQVPPTDHSGLCPACKPEPYDSTGAMAAAWFGTTGAEKAIGRVFGPKGRALPPESS